MRRQRKPWVGKVKECQSTHNLIHIGYGMNAHLNLFRFFSDGGSDPTLENNLSRGLALVFRNDPAMLIEFMRMVVPVEVYEQSVENLTSDDKIDIDLQVPASGLEGFEHIVGVTLTPERLDLTGDVFAEGAEKPIIDIRITVRNIVVIIEVKLQQIDCFAQLQNQILKATEKYEPHQFNSYTRSLSWADVVELFQKIHSYHMSLGSPNIFVQDYIEFLSANFPTWFPVRNFSYLAFATDDKDPNFHQIHKRLYIAKVNAFQSPLVDTGDRAAIAVDFGWASEINLYPMPDPDGTPSISVGVWPGDTKAQGSHLFTSGESLPWLVRSSLEVGTRRFRLTIEPYVKFGHFNRGVTWIKMPLERSQEAYSTHTIDGFETLAGRWVKDDWSRLSETLVGLVGDDWKERADWNLYFGDSNRTYVDVSLGVEVYAFIPYSLAQELDSTYPERDQVATLIQGVIQALRDMIAS